MNVIVFHLPAWFRSNHVGCVASATVRWVVLWLTYPNRCDVDSRFPRTDTCVCSIPIQRIVIFFEKIWCQTARTASKCPVLDRCFPSLDEQDSVLRSIHCRFRRFSAFYNQSERPTKQRCETINRTVVTEQIHAMAIWFPKTKFYLHHSVHCPLQHPILVAIAMQINNLHRRVPFFFSCSLVAKFKPFYWVSVVVTAFVISLLT